MFVAFTHKTFGIGKDGGMPWHICEDMARFKAMTIGNVVVMGRKTFDSLNNRPLVDRFNVIVTSNASTIVNTFDNTYYISDVAHIDNLDFDDAQTFFIGGAAIYEYALDHVDNIYATVIEKEWECDTHFPVGKLKNFEISDYSPRHFSEDENCHYRYITFTRRANHKPHIEKTYIDLMKDIINNGNNRPDRTGVGTRAVFARQLRFDLSEGKVPIVTTKQLAWRTILKELLWFLKGDCNSKNLETQGVKIWKGNTSREFLDKRGLHDYKDGDMGPLYSHSLRFFGAEYTGCDTDYTGQGYDQLTNLIDGLKNDPHSRRHLITTFNPAEVEKCVLMPCHGIAIQFYVNHDSHLDCHVYCRSSDVFLGLSFNIASYAFLTHIIAKKTNMQPGELIISTGDTHLYKNHIDQALEQISRSPLPSPIFHVLNDKPFEQMSLADFDLIGYLHHPPISAPMAV
jgi:dihydrofolate reductase/thymidylate synthase